MNGPLGFVFQDLWEESSWKKNDLDALSRITWYLDDMRGNDVPRDLFIRVRGGVSWQSPWQVDAYAEASAVGDNHRDPLDGSRRAVAIGLPLDFSLVPIREAA